MTKATPFPHFLAPMRVGGHMLRNRVIMGSMHTRLEHLDQPMARQIAFYESRAKGGAGLIVTGGFSPNEAGRMEPGGPLLDNAEQLAEHRPIVEAVQRHGTKFLLQILHAGRYAKHDGIVGVSDIASPINRRQPRPLSVAEIDQTLADFCHTAKLAQAAGYDGVELMGSEGYLINQFTAERTNRRIDDWGGNPENRHRFAIELTRRVRALCGPDFIIMYRISALDLVEGGSDLEQTMALARAIETAGADILNTGYGWHEATIPTIAYQVPRAAWRFGAARLKQGVSIPVVASNRINTPDMAEDVIASGDADLISMARPFLADPDFVRKAEMGKADEINSCIACNQACLDYIFTERSATCLVNPRAGREVEFRSGPSSRPLRLAIVGSGPAGLACAIEASQRGHAVTLFEAHNVLGGQLQWARRIPGKSEFDEMLRYFQRQLDISDIRIVTGHAAGLDDLRNFDHRIIATGVTPRNVAFPGADHPKAVNYADILSGKQLAGTRIAIIGTGGIGHDMAELLSASEEDFYAAWGVGQPAAPAPVPQRSITLLQRSAGRIGGGLGKTTGWILRSQLKRRGVQSLSGVRYVKLDDAGLHIEVDGQPRLLEVDQVVICAGQESENSLATVLSAAGLSFDLIGGAKLAGGLDAQRAIDEGTRLANRL